MNNIKTAKHLIKLAKSLISDYINEQNFSKIYNQQKIDENKLYELWDKYSDEVSKDFEARIREQGKQATVISIKKWLKNNNYEDWTIGKKFDTINKYNKEKLQKYGYEIIKENEDIYIISFEKIIKRIQEKQNKVNRIFKCNYPNEEKFMQLYNKSVKEQKK